jgi:hypothetical protein
MRRQVPRPDPRPVARPATPVRLQQPSYPSARSAPSAATLPNVELGSEHLVSLPDDTEVRIRRLIAEELPPVRPDREESTVRVQAPLSPRSLRMAVVGAISFALVWNVAIGAYRAYAAAQGASARSAPEAHERPLEAPVLPGTAAHLCALTTPRPLTHSVLVRGGVEASASESRIGLGVVKGPHEGLVLELEAASGAVRASTRVVASDVLLRVLPAFDGEMPVDATPEIGPLHAVRSAADGEAYETGVQAGFLVWRPRGRDAIARLWPMTSDVEAPRMTRAGNDRVLVYRRDGAIWLGTVQVDRDGARAGALARASEPAAQVGAPSIDGRAEAGIVAWSQRDARAGHWALRWLHWHQGAPAGPVHELTPPGADGAIAPSVAALEGGRFLLAWTEGGTGRHRVRAQLFSQDDQPIGSPLDVSPPGDDAGQAQLALTRDGHGAVGYLVAHANGFDLVATPIACQ